MFDLFWKYFHRSDASASWRWALVAVTPIGFVAVLGSLSSILAIGGAGIAWIYRLLDRSLFRMTAIERAMSGLFIAYVLVGFVFSAAHLGLSVAFQSSIRNGAFAFFLPLMPVLRVYWRPYWMDWMRRSVSFGGIAAGIVAVIQWAVWSMPRAEGGAGNALVFSYLVALLSLLNLILYLDVRTPKRALHGLGAVFAFLALLFSGSRATLLIYPAFVAIFVLDGLRTREAVNWRRATIGAYALLLLLVPTYEYFRHSEVVLAAEKRFSALFELVAGSGDPGTDISLRERIEMQKLGWHLFLEHPFAGHGRDVLPPDLHDNSNEHRYTHLHNAFLTEAVASGILGLLSYLGVLVSPVLAAWRLPRPGRQIGLTLAAFTAINATTNIGFYHDLTTSFFCLATILLAIGNNLPIGGGRVGEEADAFARHVRHNMAVLGRADDSRRCRTGSNGQQFAPIDGHSVKPRHPSRRRAESASPRAQPIFQRAVP